MLIVKKTQAFIYKFLLAAASIAFSRRLQCEFSFCKHYLVIIYIIMWANKIPSRNYTLVF